MFYTEQDSSLFFILQRQHIEVVRLVLLYGIGQLFAELLAGG